MKSPAERGPIGAWAYEARADADLSVEEVVERLTRAGQPVSAATIRGVEGGSKKPSRRLLRGLSTVYGRPAPGEPMAGTDVDTPVPAALVSALEAQTQALKDQTAAFITLAASIDRAASSVTGRVGEFGDLLGDLVRLMRPPATEPTVPSAADEHRASNHPGR